MTTPYAPYVIGIDLGTTNTLCASWQRGDPSPRILKIRQPTTGVGLDGYQRDDRGILPSAVAVLPPARGGVVVGRLAKSLARQGEQNVVLSVKRRMGTEWVHAFEGKDWPTDWVKKLGGRDWPPERVSGCILKAVRKQILTTFPTNPSLVVITIPASFGTEGRRATLRAAALAGFNPQTTLLFDEPVAALLDHLLPAETRELPTGQYGSRLMIIDIGGGTFDVSVLEMRREGGALLVDVQGRSRYTELAGDDFDLNIAGLLLQRYEAAIGPLASKFPDRAARRQVCCELLQAAEDAKIRLSTLGAGRSGEIAREPVEVKHAPIGLRWKGELSLEDLSHALQPFFWQPAAESVSPEQARRDNYSFYRPIQECLDNVTEATGESCQPADIAQVYLAGGSAQLPMISRAVQQIFPHVEPKLVSRPMQAVALGAAWYAGSQSEGFVRGKVRIQERLFEGTYLQLLGGRFLELLSPREQVPVMRRRVDTALRIPEHSLDRRVEFGLFSGASPDDNWMQPLTRRRVDFGQVLPAGHPIHLWVAVSPSRQILIECEAPDPTGSGRLRGRVEVSASLDWEEDSRPGEPEQAATAGPPLPDVNVPLS